MEGKNDLQIHWMNIPKAPRNNTYFLSSYGHAGSACLQQYLLQKMSTKAEQIHAMVWLTCGPYGLTDSYL